MYYCESVIHIKVVDHIIIGNNTYFSFANEGLIEEYELDFISLKMRGNAGTKMKDGIGAVQIRSISPAGTPV